MVWFLRSEYYAVILSLPTLISLVGSLLDTSHLIHTMMGCHARE
jgi:hypothetical protein